MSSSDTVTEIDNAIAMARLLADEAGGAPPMVDGRFEVRRILGRGANGLVCEALAGSDPAFGAADGGLSTLVAQRRAR